MSDSATIIENRFAVGAGVLSMARRHLRGCLEFSAGQVAEKYNWIVLT